VNVSLEEVVSPELAELFWVLYDESFQELNRKSPCMQRAWDHEEFMSGMADPTVMKAVLRDGDGEVQALSIWSNNLDLFPWVSQPFYQGEFPEYYNEARIYYVVATLSLDKRQGHMSQVMDVMTREISGAGGCVIFDLCDELTSISWQEVIKEVSSKVVPSDIRLLGTQTYWMAYQV